jgi:hypothetical protein
MYHLFRDEWVHRDSPDFVSLDDGEDSLVAAIHNLSDHQVIVSEEPPTEIRKRGQKLEFIAGGEAAGTGDRT